MFIFFITCIYRFFIAMLIIAMAAPYALVYFFSPSSFVYAIKFIAKKMDDKDI